ncbi:DUF308 domain-containing protein [Spirosoma pollinicola]|uniref:DUF308 domain-containing protein n=1 Tax=Spirosoma pollinicola TaxID=2057025 RepID=A0A2K8Z7M6_9BACT|nr:DUF308 domain-containing protein [Spirosoma pollinicola]AUD05871.1 hypothetical protein CWM47_30910 [Spirosoma pollinicola]RZM25066.1 MAG: hypothetical protein EOO88_20610 [Pedobacter sp.]
METITKKQTPPGWLTHLHSGCYVLMGLILFMYPIQASTLYTGLLGGLLVLAGLSTAWFGYRRRQGGQRDNSWYLLSSIRDSLFGLTLLVEMDSSLKTTVNILGLWAIIYAFLQAIEAMFYFLGTRANDDKDYWVEVIHAVCVLLAGGFAFVLIMRPEGQPTSLQFGSLFLIGLGIIQGVLTQRLRAGIA